ncbi:MAG: hypothetical protein K2W96_28715 [Gemmataceae bacterium]|nr:hypothetical protein [Gemmataceae bacterium]
MGKKNRRVKTVPSQGIQAPAPAAAKPVAAPPPQLPYVPILVLSLLVAAFVAWWCWPVPGASEGEQRDLLRRFAALVRKGDREEALSLLPPEEAFPEEEISAEEAERLLAAWFLRLPNLRVTEVLRGEPDGEGKQKPTPGRWTLGTKTGAGSPPHRVKGDTRPASVAKVNPDLVVEVRGGKIIAVRTELCLR